MKYCYCCGAQLSDAFTFCPKCGKQQPQASTPIPQSPVQEIVPKYVSQPLAQQSAPQANTQSPQPTVNKSALFFGKIGFGLGIAATAVGVLFVALYAILSKRPNLYIFSESLPVNLGIAALVLSCIARKRGNYGKVSLFGMILGIAGLALGVICTILFLLVGLESGGFGSDFVI